MTIIPQNRPISQTPPENRGLTQPSPYAGPPDPLLERLVDRPYSRHRSLLVDWWLQYSDLEGFTASGKEVAA